MGWGSINPRGWRCGLRGLSTCNTCNTPILFLFPKGSPSTEPGQSCVSLNPGKNAKWENLNCAQKLGYICKKGNTTLNPFVIPLGK